MTHVFHRYKVASIVSWANRNIDGMVLIHPYNMDGVVTRAQWSLVLVRWWVGMLHTFDLVGGFMVFYLQPYDWNSLG